MESVGARTGNAKTAVARSRFRRPLVSAHAINFRYSERWELGYWRKHGSWFGD